MAKIIQDTIKETFIKIYKMKGMGGITIKHLCQEVPIARTTFYTYYENLDDVLSEIENEFINQIKFLAHTMSAGNIGALSFSNFFDAVMEHIRANWDTVEALLVLHPDIRFAEKWKDAIKYHFRMRFPDKTNLRNYEMIAEAIACAVLGCYTYWLKHPNSFDSRELNRITLAAFSSIDDVLEK